MGAGQYKAPDAPPAASSSSNERKTKSLRLPWHNAAAQKRPVARRREKRGWTAIGANLTESTVVRSTVGGRTTLRGHGGVLITPAKDEKDATWHTFRVSVKQVGHNEAFSFAGALVQTFVTSTWGPTGTSASTLSAFDDTGTVSSASVRCAKTVPRGVFVHLSVVSNVETTNGLHALHVEEANALVSLDQLVSNTSVRVQLMDAYGDARKMGQLEITLLSQLPTIDKSLPPIVRPTSDALAHALRRYIDAFAAKTVDALDNNIRLTDGSLYEHEPAKDISLVDGNSLPLLMFLYAATRLKAVAGHENEFADAQIRAGCFLARVRPSELSHADDATKLLVLCNAARVLGWTISVSEEYRGSGAAIPLAASSIGHFSGQCVEHSTLTATVLMHIRDSTSSLCRVLQPLLADYRIGHMLMTCRMALAPGNGGSGVARHLVTALVPKSALLALDRSPSQPPPLPGGFTPDQRRPFCLLDTVCRTPVSKYVRHPGAAAEHESRVLAGILPTEWDEQMAFTGADRRLDTCMEIHLVDGDIRQMACVSILGGGGGGGAGTRAAIGIPMSAFYANALAPATHRLWTPLPLTAKSPEFVLCRPLFDETRLLSNLYQTPSDPEYLSDTSTLYDAIEAVLKTRDQPKAGQTLGWRIGVYDYVAEEANTPLVPFMTKSVEASNRKAENDPHHHMTAIRSDYVGRVLLCADVRATVYVVSYIHSSR